METLQLDLSFGNDVNSTFSDQFNKDNADVQSFLLSFAINTALGLAALCTFFLLRPCRCSRRLLNCRRFYNARTKGAKNANRSISYVKTAEYESVEPERLNLIGIHKRIWRGWGSWVWPTIWSYKNDRLLRTHGADALMYLLLSRNTVYLVLAIMVPVIAVLIPIHVSGSNNELPEDDPNYVAGVARLTVSNVVGDRKVMTAHVVFLWVFSLMMYCYVYFTYRTYLIIRKKWLSMNNARAFTVMIQEIPRQFKSHKKLMDFFEANFPRKPMSARIVQRTGPPREIMDKWKKYVNLYEAALMSPTEKSMFCCPWPKTWPGGEFGPEDPKTRLGRFGFCKHSCIGPKVDALEYYKEKILKYEKQIDILHEQLVNPGYVPKGVKRLKRVHVGFATFDHPFMTRVHAFGTVHAPIRVRPPNPLLMNMTIRPAPDYSDIFWENLPIIRMSFLFRSAIIWTAAIVVTFLWVIPTVFILSIANLNYLSTLNGLTWLSFVNDLPDILRGLIQGWIPSLALYLECYLVYPIICFVVNRYQGHHIKSHAAWTVFYIFWFFMTVNTVFIATIGGSLFKILDQAIDEPSSLIDLISTSLPQQSLFFTQYIMVAGLGEVPFGFVRLWDGLKQGFCLCFCSHTNREKNEVRLPGGPDYAASAAQDLIVLGLTFVYCLLDPIVVIFAFIYFVLSYLCGRYNTLYVYVPEWESGGQLWPVAFHVIMFFILLFQAVMVGFLAINVPTAIPALVIPPVVTVLLWAGLYFSWADAAFYGPVKHISRSKFEYKPHFSDTYVDPALRPDFFEPYDFNKTPLENKQPGGISSNGTNLDELANDSKPDAGSVSDSADLYSSSNGPPMRSGEGRTPRGGTLGRAKGADASREYRSAMSLSDMSREIIEMEEMEKGSEIRRSRSRRDSSSSSLMNSSSSGDDESDSDSGKEEDSSSDSDSSDDSD
eukprot:TRINITY_DN9586_c0_g1_i1.p1 TRINITY_DN9586_c0_g1~~TRINITY_DN9586_c0_g1_i1.p1  ORF type:complete len:940 (-),score=115.85 TRINITY_DN9586_c0_g1_i1:44-2863(-)